MNHVRENLIALAGNPNCGKTTLFNAITGSRQHVGNYPGITVEKKEGYCQINGRQIELVDLPGTYSLTAYSLEELVARNFLIDDRPSAVINIVDASNLERNLYLTVQLLELGIPVLIALNMIDMATARGLVINCEELGRRLRVLVIPTVARSGKGKEYLLGAAMELAQKDAVWEPLHISYGPDIDPVLDRMEEQIQSVDFLTDSHPPRWTALKYLESDEEVIRKGKEKDSALSAKLEELAEQVSQHLQNTLDSYPEAIIADYRYGFISALLKEGVVKRGHKADRLYLSDQLDRVLTNRFFGPVLMMLIIYCVYTFTFTYSKVPVGWLEAGFSALGRFADSSLPPGPLKSLIVSGVIDGVGGVLGFVPLIMFMFFAIAYSGGYGIPGSSSLYARPHFSDFRPPRQFGHGLHHFGGDRGRLCRPRSACHEDPQKPARAACHTDHSAVHELRGQAACFRDAYRRVFFRKRSAGHVHSDHPVMGGCPADRKADPLDHSAGAEHTFFAGAASIPPSDFQGASHPHLGTVMAVHLQSRYDHSWHFRRLLGTDVLPWTSASREKNL